MSKERPILFSAPMVRAILEDRKTVTRRAIKVQPQSKADIGSYGVGQPFIRNPDIAKASPECPYGRPGDGCGVRETWGVISHDFDEYGNIVDWVTDRPATPIREMPFGRGYYTGHAIYRADGDAEWAGDDDGGGDPRSAWKPSIHMPRVASRILEIADVRVEQLQDINAEQCLAEGVKPFGARNGFHIEDGKFYTDHPLETFAGLWQSINGLESWRAHPWVWSNSSG